MRRALRVRTVGAAQARRSFLSLVKLAERSCYAFVIKRKGRAIARLERKGTTIGRGIRTKTY